MNIPIKKYIVFTIICSKWGNNNDRIFEGKA